MPKISHIVLCLATLFPSYLVPGVLHAQPTPARATFAGAVARAAPAVVNIYAEKKVATSAASLMGDPLLDQLLGLPQAARQRVEKSLGSGVIVRAEGIVVTNLHVIQGATLARAILHDGQEIPLQLIGVDDKTDIAVLRLQAKSNQRFPAITFSNSDTLKVGDVVLAVGNPFGLGQSVSQGVISAAARANANLSNFSEFIQTDAAINPGNSGGALVDSNGQMVGLNTAIFTRSGGSLGISFAMPGNLVQNVVNDLVSQGRVVRPWLGLDGESLPQAVATSLGVRGGVVVRSVMPSSPAGQGGVAAGDIITQFNGKAVQNPAQLNELLVGSRVQSGASASLSIIRSGQTITLSVPLQALPARQKSNQWRVPGFTPLSDYTLELLTPSFNAELGLPLASTGVAVAALPQQPPAGVLQFRLQVGDVLLRLNNQNITNLQDAKDILTRPSRRWQLAFRRGPNTYTVRIE
jgi:Do/DeqQ family serine protease